MFLLPVLLAVVAVCSAEDRSCIAVYGYSSCAYYQRASCWANHLKATKEFSVATIGGSRDEYQTHLARLKGEKEEKKVFFLIWGFFKKKKQILSVRLWFSKVSHDLTIPKGPPSVY